jgi:hypothetical protein
VIFISNSGYCLVGYKVLLLLIMNTFDFYPVFSLLVVC